MTNQTTSTEMATDVINDRETQRNQLPQVTNTTRATNNRTQKIPISLLIIFCVFSIIILGITIFSLIYHSTTNIVMQTQIPLVITPTEIPEIPCGSVSFTLPLPSPIQNPSLECFITATKTCQKANIVMTGTINNNGVTTTTETYAIQGIKNSSCQLLITQGAIQHIFPTGTPLPTKNTIAQLIQKKIGTNATCLFATTTDLTNIFLKWKSGNFSTSNNPSQSDFSQANCTGTYFTQ